MENKKIKFITLEELEGRMALTKADLQKIEAEETSIMKSMNLRMERKSKNLSQVALARKAKLPRSTIARFESGSCNPRLDSLWKIAKALDMEIEIHLVPAQAKR